jgi:ubiquinone/menaquinone biosynthesis C-methylase UbiE
MVPVFFEPFAIHLASRLASTTSGSILELAAGTGVVSRALARALPPAVSLVASEIHPALMEFAASRSDSRVVWRQADAQHLPFPDDSFGVIVCQYGVMFFPDKVAVYREARAF